MYPAKLALLLCCLVFSAHAATFNWPATTPCTTNTWSDPTCWNEGAVPTAADDAYISGSALVILITAPTAVNSVDYESSDSTSMMTITATLTITTVFKNNYNGGVTIAAGGSIVGSAGSTAYYYNEYSGAVLLVGGTVSIPITNGGTLGCGGGGSISGAVTNTGTFGINAFGSTATVSGAITSTSGMISIIGGTVTGAIDCSGGSMEIAQGSTISDLTTDYYCPTWVGPTVTITKYTTSGTVTFQGPPGQAESIMIDSLECDSADFIFGNDTVVNVVKMFNSTGSQSTFSGQGTFTMMAGSENVVDNIDISDDVVVYNDGNTVAGPATGSGLTDPVEFNGNGMLINNGAIDVNGRFYFYSSKSSFINNGDITSSDDGSNTYACYFYNADSGTGNPNMTNNGNITCPKVQLYYMPINNGDNANIDTEQLVMSGASDGSSISITFTSDVKNLVLNGYGTIIFNGVITVDSIETTGGYPYLSSTGGNTTVHKYNGTTSTYWQSDPDSVWIFDGEWTSSSEGSSGYTETLKNCTWVFPDNTNQTSYSYFVLSDAIIYFQGHFQRGGSYWTMDSSSTIINQGYFESLSSWSVDTTGTSEPGTIYNVGIMRLTDGAVFDCHFGNCDGGLVQLADTTDTTFYNNYINANGRIANDGNIDLLFGEQVPDDFKFTTYENIVYYSSSKTSYPDDYDSNGIPIAFSHHKDLTVDVKCGTSGCTIDISFKDVDVCFNSVGLYVISKGEDYAYTCEDQPDFEKLLCDVNLPAATVDVGNPPGSTASSMVFSVLSVFIIASLFILF